jgi:hypothetical protein
MYPVSILALFEYSRYFQTWVLQTLFQNQLRTSKKGVIDSTIIIKKGLGIMQKTRKAIQDSELRNFFRIDFHINFLLLEC